ncbi:helix-turn-helix domain-containing protein [Lactococcus petauri]|uniref:helix-turn-helix domain-containing protein n=1 Tax=Lactococcus petauri TaxID=1940789 RepID=UPI0025503B1E|nr:helix-turn-helix domain-containing protein [Lactococcus petauri]
MKTNTSNRLRQLMSERNLKQVDIINLSLPFQKKFNIKLSKSTLSQYVNGIQSPDQNRIYLLSKTLGVNEAWLLGYDVPMTESSTKVERVDSHIIEETVETMEKLDEPRQQFVLNTAKEQHKEQEAEKILSLNHHKLSDEYLDAQINKASAYGGGELSDNDKEFFKRLLKNTLQERIDRGE